MNSRYSRIKQKPTWAELADSLRRHRELESMTEIVCRHIAEDARVPEELREEARELGAAWERMRRWKG